MTFIVDENQILSLDFRRGIFMTVSTLKFQLVAGSVALLSAFVGTGCNWDMNVSGTPTATSGQILVQSTNATLVGG